MCATTAGAMTVKKSTKKDVLQSELVSLKELKNTQQRCVKNMETKMKMRIWRNVMENTTLKMMKMMKMKNLLKGIEVATTKMMDQKEMMMKMMKKIITKVDAMMTTHHSDGKILTKRDKHA